MNKVKNLKDIENDIRVDEIYKDIEGYWCYLTDNYENDNYGQLIHENTIKQVCEVFNFRTYKKITN